MAAAGSSSSLKHGTPVLLRELHPASRFCKPDASLRVTGRLQTYDVETGIVVLAEGDASVRVDTQHLRDLAFRVNSLFQFIGELQLRPNSPAVLRARVGRNVDGLDLQLYERALQLRRQFERKQGWLKPSS